MTTASRKWTRKRIAEVLELVKHLDDRVSRLEAAAMVTALLSDQQHHTGTHEPPPDIEAPWDLILPDANAKIITVDNEPLVLTDAHNVIIRGTLKGRASTASLWGQSALELRGDCTQILIEAELDANGDRYALYAEAGTYTDITVRGCNIIGSRPGLTPIRPDHPGESAVRVKSGHRVALLEGTITHTQNAKASVRLLDISNALIQGMTLTGGGIWCGMYNPPSGFGETWLRDLVMNCGTSTTRPVMLYHKGLSGAARVHIERVRSFDPTWAEMFPSHVADRIDVIESTHNEVPQ